MAEERGLAMVSGGLSKFAARPAVWAGPIAWPTRGRLTPSCAMLALGGAAALEVPASPPPHGGAARARRLPWAAELSSARHATGLRLVAVVADPREVGEAAAWADLLMIGAASMQDFALLREAARAGRPVVLTRGASSTLGEWLGASEYLTAGGEHRIVLREAGSRTFARPDARTLDLVTALEARERTGFPLIVAAGTGGPAPAAHPHLAALAAAALAAGADAIALPVGATNGGARWDADEFLGLVDSLGLAPAGAYLTLEGVRSAIDRVDDAVLRLIARRMALSCAAAARKEAAGLSVRQTERERTVVRRLAGLAEGRMDSAEVAQIWRAVLRVSRDRQRARRAPAAAPPRTAGAGAP